MRRSTCVQRTDQTGEEKSKGGEKNCEGGRQIPRASVAGVGKGETAREGGGNGTQTGMKLGPPSAMKEEKSNSSRKKMLSKQNQATGEGSPKN